MAVPLLAPPISAFFSSKPTRLISFSCLFWGLYWFFDCFSPLTFSFQFRYYLLISLYGENISFFKYHTQHTLHLYPSFHFKDITILVKPVFGVYIVVLMEILFLDELLPVHFASYIIILFFPRLMIVSFKLRFRYSNH